MALPQNFVESADEQLELKGELLAYVNARGPLFPVEDVKRLEDAERKSFFSNQAESELWDVYFASGASGARYSVLVEFHVHPGVRFDATETRREIYREYDALFAGAVIEALARSDMGTTEMVTDHAMGLASARIMRKYGISTEEMGAIIAEGLREHW